MNDQANPYDAALADLRAKREHIDRAIVHLEALQEWVLVSDTDRNGVEISACTFHGMSIEVATKTLLQMRKQKMGAQEIVTNLRAGGFHFQSETPTNSVTSVLTRAFNAGGDIVRVSRGQWGLQEWGVRNTPLPLRSAEPLRAGPLFFIASSD